MPNVLAPTENPTTWGEVIRTIATIVTVVLASTNLVYAIKIFRYKDKKEDSQKEKDIRAAAFKNIILDKGLDAFFEFFKTIETRLLELRETSISLERKQEINQFVIDQANELRQGFVDTIRSVSENLSDRILRHRDPTTDRITEEIFNEDCDLSDQQLL